MAERFRRMLGSRRGRLLVRQRAAEVERSADIGAKTFGLAWLYVLGIYLIVLIGVWIAALLLWSWIWLGIAVAVTLAVVPPMRREFRHRAQVRRAIEGDRPRTTRRPRNG